MKHCSHNTWHFLFFLTGFFATVILAGAEEVRVEQFLDWKDPFKLTREQFIAIARPIHEATGRKLDETRELGLSIHTHNQAPLVIFDEKIPVSYLFASWGEIRQFQIDFSSSKITQKEIDLVHENLVEIHGGDKGRAYETNFERGARRMEWATSKGTITSINFPDGRFVVIVSELGSSQVASNPTEPLAANLDALLNFATLWSTSPDAFDQLYTAKAAKKEDQKKPPQFEWMNAEKTRARFSRQMFSNAETKLTMFANSIKVEEAVVEFVNGKAAKSTISFYNRGDSGDIEVKDFDRIFKTIGQNLGQVLKVAPKRQINSTNAALPVAGWMWTSPQATALLEYNEYQVPGKVIKPEFLRLKLAAPGQSDYTMGKMVTGVQSMELIKRVTKKPDGEVYITGVPMVDQGQKGYCVAASCQRLFEYMRIPCDQHEMAQLVQVDADSGANVFGMQKSLAKIDQHFKVAFKPLVNPELYYNSGKRRVSEKEFMNLVKEYVNKGVPLLWALELGKAQEDPPLPGSGQTRGGHMRMIIGYKLEKNLVTQILFSDSWGAGHELKRMGAYDAYDVTIGLYSMAPRGL